MTFDPFGAIDRQFKPKSRIVALECCQCDSADGVRMLYPCWNIFGIVSVPIPLCPDCGQLQMPKRPV